MNKLTNLMERLNTDKYQAVTIINRDTGEKICNNFLGSDIIGEFGSAEEFFQDLQEKNITNLQVISRKKNGSVFKTLETFNVETETEDEDDEPIKIKKNKPKPKKKKKNKNVFGLGMPEIMDMKISAFEKERLSIENAKLLQENDTLKQKNTELERRELERQYKKEKNDSLNNLLSGIMQQAPVILKSVGLKVDVPVASAGLSNPSIEEITENLTAVQRDFIGIVKGTDDNMLQILYTILNQITDGENGAFAQELDKILRQFNLLQDENN